MSGIKNKSESATSRRKRVIKVAPMTRAVRVALAASLAALTLGASGGAFAAGCKTPSTVMIPCTQAVTDATPVLDLTLVPHAAASSALIMPLAISQSSAGDVVINNADPISEYSFNYNATAISGYSSGGRVDITNQATGTLEAISIYGSAIGIYGYSIAGDVTIGNSGHITATSANGLADGIFASGANVGVTNSGVMQVHGQTWAAGIEAQGTGTTTVHNSGDIYVDSGAAGAHSYGIYATGGVVEVTNTAGINAQGFYATGIEAQGGSSVTITNNGDIVAGAAYTSALATGINATSNFAGGAITITNTAGVSANGFFGGTGIAATTTGTGGSASVTNSGSIHASQYTRNGYGAYGIVASADGNATVDNSLTGSISVNTPGIAGGAVALSFAGNASATNGGDINVYGYMGADGIVSFAQNGSAYAGNAGTIEVGSGYVGHGIDVGGLSGATAVNSGAIAVDAFSAYGIHAESGNGDVSVHTTGSIDATYTGPFSGKTAFGVLATSVKGDVSVENGGDIATSITGQSVGIFASTTYGKVDESSSGTISAYSNKSTAVGMFGRATNGTAMVDNSGMLSAQSSHGNAFAVLARGNYVDVSNSGDITASGYAGATGIAARSYYGTTVTTTGGAITAYALGQANGIDAQSSYGDVSVVNASSVDAQGLILGAKGIQGIAYGNVGIANSGNLYAGSMYGSSAGIYGHSIAGDVTITNSGSIMAVANGATANVAGVQMKSLNGQSTLTNTSAGSISVSGTEGYAFAVLGSDAIDTINNSGHINGAVSLHGGNDVFNNRSGGVWDVGTTYSTNFGAGDDTINNLVGGTIRLDGGAIYLGSSVNGNAFNNAGRIKVLGDSLIDMGSGGVTLVPSLNPLAFVNNGVIDMTDGAADDSLTIVGDLSGTGALNIDVMVPNGPADTLYVDGSVLPGAVQTVNATFSPSLLLAAQSHASVDFAFVSGNSSAGSFVGGQVIGYDPSNFLNLDVVVRSQISTANTANDVFSVGVDAIGLNDTGSLAASIASGAAGMLNAQVGTFKQRMGVNPYGDTGKVMSAFFRTYTSHGDVNPTHAMANFGQGGNFDYDQSVWGREVGVNANLYQNLHAGLVLGSADGRQRLTGNGVGQNRMDGMTWGMYATWLVPQGFYVDLSGRWMAVDVRSTSVAGTLPTRAHTGAWNVEAGYEWALGGLSVVPQLQYTRTKVDGVRAIYGSAATFESQGGTSSRGRLGVEVSKTFDSAGVRWTPYGSINAIREFDGDMSYTVANVFNGGTSIHGTSIMAELGLGVQKGAWGVTLGANWLDGGAYKSTVGGQALVRFAW